jgi:hypothetical protein
MAKTPKSKKKPTPAVSRAARDLRKGFGDAGLALEELKQLKKRVAKLEKKQKK